MPGSGRSPLTLSGVVTISLCQSTSTLRARLAGEGADENIPPECAAGRAACGAPLVGDIGTCGELLLTVVVVVSGLTQPATNASVMLGSASEIRFSSVISASPGSRGTIPVP